MLDQGNRREAAEGPGGGSLPMQEMEGVRDQNITWKLQGEKLRQRERWCGIPSSAGTSPPPHCSTPAVRGLLSPDQDKGRAGITEARDH